MSIDFYIFSYSKVNPRDVPLNTMAGAMTTEMHETKVLQQIYKHVFTLLIFYISDQDNYLLY